MNKEQFIMTLEKELIRLPKADRDDILSDYEAHFAAGFEDGKTEEEVSAALGDPSELAAVYLENLPEGSKGEQYIPYNYEGASASENYADNAQSGQYKAPNYDNRQQDYQSNAQQVSYANTEQNNSTDKTAAIIIVVLLSLFVALPVLFSVAGIWLSLIGIAVGCAIAVIPALIAGFGILSASVIGGLGVILISVALAAMAGLSVVGVIAGGKAIALGVDWYVKLCNKMISGGINL